MAVAARLRALLLVSSLLLGVTPVPVARPAAAAEVTLGTIAGRVLAPSGTPVAGAHVVAAAPSGRYEARTGPEGRYAILGVAPDTYTIEVRATGFADVRIAGVTVFAGARAVANVALVPALARIGRTTTAPLDGAGFGETPTVYRVTGEAARGAGIPGASGLATYTAGTVESAVAGVPGIQQDPFANAIVRGGKVEDTVFSYDGIPVPQALIAEPGGNVIGAQLATTGVASTNVTTGGFTNQSNTALGAVVDQIVATGTFPARTTLTLGGGLLSGLREVAFESRWATPDLRNRYAVAGTLRDEAIRYGDGRSFYPAEAATYGLALASKAAWSLAANAHVRLGARDDVGVVALAGEATYDQYGTPFAGETYGAFDGASTRFPNEPSPAAAVTSPSQIRGTYAVLKTQLTHETAHALLRAQLYRSQYGAATDAPFFDDLSFPNGVVSYAGAQSGWLDGFALDVQNLSGERHELSYGAELRTQTSALDQLVPTLDQRVTSHPVLDAAVAYLADRWSPSARFAAGAALRLTATHVARSDGNRYDMRELDPHFSAVYRAGQAAVRVTYDRTSVAPLPLQAERNDSAAPAGLVQLRPEIGDGFETSLESTGRFRARLTYFSKRERNLIDVLPANFRAAIAAGSSPGGIGVPTNAGRLLAHGVEFGLEDGPVSLSATAVRAFSSSASQFGYNDLNAPAVAAGHLFPIGYVPDFSAIVSYRARLGARLTITPSLSYESGYPYGNGRAVWIFDPTTNAPVQVPNDNHLNPGYNYYFLRDPSQPYDAVANPFVASLGTPEGDDPNTLRSKPQLLVSLHAELTLTPRVSLLLDATNLFGTSSPTQLQGNPYLIGPPGYAGGDAAYAAYYGSVFSPNAGTPYVLGNGVPTNDGRTAAVPWTYGTGAYVPSSYPQARTLSVRLRVRI